MTIMNKTNKYAINEKKQAELDALTAQVSQATYQVEQLQAIVNSLTQKNTDFAVDLASATADRDTALSNLNLLNQVINSIKKMIRTSTLTLDQTSKADNKISQTASQLALLTNQLIFSVEMIDKLALMINKKKASRSTLSDQLVTIINNSSADANNAVAVTLTALNSCYVAMASSSKAEKITLLECKQSIELYGLLTGDEAGKKELLKKFEDVEKAQQQSVNSDDLTTVTQPEITSASQNPSASINEDLEKAKTELEKMRLELAEMKKVQAPTQTESEENVESSAGHLEQKITELETELKNAEERVKELIACEETQCNPSTSQQPETAPVDMKTALANFQQTVVETIGFKQKSLQPAESSLNNLVIQANIKAISKYEAALKANNRVIKELSQAQITLDHATVELNSLNAGLAAATAASLAA